MSDTQGTSSAPSCATPDFAAFFASLQPIPFEVVER